MRKWHKQEILEFIFSLHQAHKEIKTALHQKNISSVKNMLSECQEFAIELGNCIESIEGEGHVTISFVQEYCESVFCIYEELTNTQIDSNKSFKLLEKKLWKIENSVKRDIQIRKEIVFFPYNASMWDSMEAVYFAEKENGKNDVYCVPIPYYDLNPDRSFGQMHYEGMRYPEEIDITDWQKYQFEKRKPDVIYIHNPYDNWNLVTSVHPRFYSDNLKKYTERLVYIPYFVLGEIGTDDVSAVESIKSFIWLPGIINADQVLLQSENIRQVYISEYGKKAAECGLQGKHLDRKYLERKFLGSGSPKFERVLRTRKEELEIPEQWSKIIVKPDGSRRKIILYNTSVTALLAYSEKWIDKIKDVLKIFKCNQDQIVLLWRPHPLIESTLKAMRPAILDKYLKMKNEYITEEWGIFDNTSDVDRAVVLSDGYYGDKSSVVMLYRQSGKPVMLQNIELMGNQLWKLNSNKQMRIHIEDVVVNKDKIWFCAMDFNGLFCMDFATSKTVLAGRFPEEPYSGQRLYASMKLIRNKIYFVPFNARSIAIFHMDNGRFSNISLGEAVIHGKGKPLFMGVEEYGDYLYLLPAYCDVIIRLNTENNELEYITGWVEQVKGIVFTQNEVYFRRQACIRSSKIIVPFCNANAVLELDCNTLQCTVLELGIEKRGYSGICYDGQKFWLSPRKSNDLATWNDKTKQLEVTSIRSQEAGKESYAYVGILYYGGRVTLFPSRGEGMLDIGGKISVAEGQYTFVKEEKDIVVNYEKKSGKLSIINRMGETGVIININSSDFDFISFLKEKEYIVDERKELNINSFINFEEI